MGLQTEIACGICGNDMCNQKPLEPAPYGIGIECPEHIEKSNWILAKMRGAVEGAELTDEEIRNFIISHGWILSPAKLTDMIAQYQELAKAQRQATLKAMDKEE